MIGSRRIGVKKLKIAVCVFDDKFVILDNTLINIVVPYNTATKTPPPLKAAELSRYGQIRPDR